MEIKNFCPECGHKLDGGGKFCPNCGFNLTTEETSPDSTAVSMAVVPPNPIVTTRQTNAHNANEYENELLIKKHSKETEELETAMRGCYVGAAFCASALAFVVVFVEGGWGLALVKWIIFVPGLLISAIVLLSIAGVKKGLYKKVKDMSIMEYKNELAKRERNKEMAVDFAKGFAKGFAQGYIREKFRNY